MVDSKTNANANAKEDFFDQDSIPEDKMKRQKDTKMGNSI